MKLALQRSTARRNRSDASNEESTEQHLLPVLTAPSFDPNKIPTFDSTASLWSALGVGVAIFSRQDSLIFCNDEFSAHTAMHADKLKHGEPLNTFCENFCREVYATEREALTQAVQMLTFIRETLQSGEAITDHGNITTHDNRRLNVKRVFPGNGQFIISCDDLTESTRDSEYLSLGLELGSSGYWTLNFETGKFTFSDYILSRLSEKDLSKIAANGLFAIIHKDDLPTIMGPWLKAIETGERLDITYRVFTENDGEGWQRTVGRIIYEGPEKTKTFIGFVTDITQDMQLRQDLSEAQAASRTKSEFLARMSHEIKTPLNAIIGMADALSDSDMDEETREAIDYILTAADELDETLSQTLRYSRLTSASETINTEDVRLNGLMKTVRTKWENNCKRKGITLRIHAQETLPAVINTDSDKILQIANAVLSNAVKFTSTGDIKVLFTQQSPGELTLVIRDTGIGMSREQQETLFVPFKQGDDSRGRRYGGIGMGMTVVKGLVDLLGGKIAVKSQADQGTTVIVSVPVSKGVTTKIDIAPDKTIETPKVASQPASSPPARSYVDPLGHVYPSDETPDAQILSANLKAKRASLRILCAEDNPVNQAVVTKLIGSSVGKINFVNNGQEALDILQSREFDLILMDIHMPVKDGIETTLAIRNSNQSWATTPIIALTADPDYQQARLCRNIGMDDCVAKPYRKINLLSALDKICETHKLDPNTEKSIDVI